MVIKILFFLSIMLYLVYTAVKIKQNIHMLQLNSYMNERYALWVKRNLEKAFNIKELIPLIAVILLFFRQETLGLLAAIILYIVMVSIYKNEKQKKKLVFTSRVNRLIFTISLFHAIIIILMLLLMPWNTDVRSIAYMFLILTAINFVYPAVIILCNTINYPVESSIKRHYYNNAKNKLKSMPDVTVIGITGSYGKTSTKHVINKILSKKYNVLMTPESYNTTMGVTLTINNHLKPTHEVFIAEMGAKNIGDVKEICDLVSPKFGVLTSIGPQHLESFKTIDNVKKAKFELIEALPEDGKGFENMDDENIKTLPKPKCNVIGYGIDGDNIKFRAENIKFSSKGSTFDVYSPEGTKESFQTKLLGKHNIYNILSGVAVGSELGMDMKTISYAVRDLEPIEHRLQLRRMQNGITIIDDAYNSNPVGSRMALEVLGKMEGKKIMITPGMIELGDKEYELNKAFGEYASEVCDYIILVGKKQTRPIQDGLKEKKYDENKLCICGNLTEAFKEMNKVAEEGSIVLLENDLTDDYNE